MGVWSPTENLRIYWTKTSNSQNILTSPSPTFSRLWFCKEFSGWNTNSGNSGASASFQSQQVSPKKMFRLLLPGTVVLHCLDSSLVWGTLQCLCSTPWSAPLQHFSLTPLGEKSYEVNSQDLQGWRNRVSRVHISTWTAHWNQFGILFNCFSTVPFTEQPRRSNASCWLCVSSTHSPQSPLQTNSPLPTKRRKSNLCSS